MTSSRGVNFPKVHASAPGGVPCLPSRPAPPYMP